MWRPAAPGRIPVMENGSRTIGRGRKAAYLLTGLGLSAALVCGAVAFGRA
ncbi:hypothetical protein GCM10018790_58470 [Kitasatospora xanthocidica]|nr:hypothetical protein GCM10018790_58470 [Kitasatospora xanthocidica]